MPPDWYVIPVFDVIAAFCLITVGWHLRGWWDERHPTPTPDATTQIPMPGLPGVDAAVDDPEKDEDAVHATWARLRDGYEGEKS